MAEFTTMEIAFRTRKSERQVQRWIQSGKLPAIHLQGNLYEVNEDDLTPFLPHEVVTDLVERIASLEHRVHVLEATIEGLSKIPHTHHRNTRHGYYMNAAAYLRAPSLMDMYRLLISSSSTALLKHR